MKKRIVCFLLTLSVLLVLAGCSEEYKVPVRDTFIDEYPTFEIKVSEQFTSATKPELRAASLTIPSENEMGADEMAYLLYRLDERTVLEEAGAVEKVFPASTTKLLTTYVTLLKGNLDDTVTFSKKAVNVCANGAVACGFAEGDQMKLGDLLTAMLVCSGNDAAMAIAEHVGGSEEKFVAMMNSEMLRLGGVDSHFENPHGLQNTNHKATAYDLYLVFNELLSYDKFISSVSSRTFTMNYTDKKGNEKTATFESTNQFFTGTYKAPDGIQVIGGKTGTTNAAGYCLTLLFKDNKGHSYIAEVFHASSYKALYEQMIKLMEKALTE